MDSIGIFLTESLVCSLWQQSMATGFFCCLFVWINCTCIMTAMHGHWIGSVSFCLNHLHVHYDRYAWLLDCIGVFLSESIVCALWQQSMSTGFYWCLFVWINCMCIMTVMHGRWIVLVSFWLNHLYMHYDSYAWPLDSIAVFLSESIVCALWQLCMATGLYWYFFVWITCMCIMKAMHGHWIVLVSFCLNHLHVHYDSYSWPLDYIGVFLTESLVCALWQQCMSTGFYWCLFVWINCMWITTAMHGHWILLVSFCLNHLYVHYDS